MCLYGPDERGPTTQGQRPARDREPGKLHPGSFLIFPDSGRDRAAALTSVPFGEVLFPNLPLVKEVHLLGTGSRVSKDSDPGLTTQKAKEVSENEHRSTNGIPLSPVTRRRCSHRKSYFSRLNSKLFSMTGRPVTTSQNFGVETKSSVSVNATSRQYPWQGHLSVRRWQQASRGKVCGNSSSLRPEIPKRLSSVPTHLSSLATCEKPRQQSSSFGV
ncbi:hypothetical protein R6Z07M_009932 [Ovis aries]